MESTNLLLVGLPGTGKSTYLTALWAVEKDGKSNHLLSCDGLPSESSYIDSMRDNWMELKIVRRTTFAEPMKIDIPMKSRETGVTINLSLPDFKGEVFQKVLDNIESDDVKNWCSKSNGILFMLNIGSTSPEMLQDQISEDSKPMPNIEKVVMLSNNINSMIQNVLLIKYLFNNMGDCPISICFSSWDQIDCASGMKVEDWVKDNHPCIYNYVSSHFSKYYFFGVSAQGDNYDDLDEKSEDILAQKTNQKERAYVYTDGISYDITEPIDILIKD